MAAVITPVKQQQQQPLTLRRSTGPTSAGERRKRRAALLQQLSPEKEQQQQKEEQRPILPYHRPVDYLAPALSISTRKRTREINIDRTITQQQATAVVPPATLDENSDLIRNGRALFAATTTSLGAPLDIPNKRRRTTQDDAPFTHPNATILATPNRTSSLTNAAAGSKKLSSKKKKGSSASKQQAKQAATEAGVTAARDGVDRRLQQELAAAEWEKKYKAAFKSFVFYFDGLEEGKRKEGERALRELGARTESFFSKGVTHIVTSRPIPANAPAPTLPSINSAISNKNNAIFLAPAAGKENVVLPPMLQKRGDSESPVKQSGLNGSITKQQDSLVGPARRTRARIGVAAVNNSVIPMRTPPKLKAFADAADSQDILVKALSFGMKIWTVEKLQKMLARLLDPKSPSKAFLYPAQQQQSVLGNGVGYQFNFQGGANAPSKPSLPSLLRAEQLTGSTYERDLTTVRPDHYYFSSKNGYILVEDSSGEYQPAHAKEYDQRIVPRIGEGGEDRDTEWPTLWGGQEGRGAFFKPLSNYNPPLPNFQAFEEPKKIQATLLAVPTNNTAPSLRRSVSMNALRSRHATNGNGMQQPSVNLDSYQAASGNSQIITSNIASGTSTTTTRSGHVIGVVGVGGKNSLADGIIVDKRLARLGSKAKKHIVTLGRNAHAMNNKENVPIGGTATTSAVERIAAMKRNLENIKTTVKAPREEVKKPGYCENCRVRYEDFKAHTRSRKHRRFALDSSNWEDLDALLSSISRPVNTELLELYDAAGCDVPSDVERSDDEDEDDISSSNGEEEDCGIEQDDSGYISKSDYEELYAHVRKCAGHHGHQVPRKLWKKRPIPDEEDENEEEDLGDEDTADDECDEEEEENSDSVQGSTSEEEEALDSQSGTASDEEDEE